MQPRANTPSKRRTPDVVKLCVGIATVQQLVQICQHRAEVIVIPMPKRRRRALERFQFRTLGVDTRDDLFELFRNVQARFLGEPQTARFQQSKAAVVIPASKWITNNVGKVVSDRLIAEQSQPRSFASIAAPA